MRRKRKRPVYYAVDYIKETSDKERREKCFCKKSKLWKEVEALFWSLAFKEDIERDLPQGCTWVQKAPGCP